MEERKIIDLTGNREEVIAPKTPDAGNTKLTDERNNRTNGGENTGKRNQKHKNKKKNHKGRRDADRRAEAVEPEVGQPSGETQNPVNPEEDYTDPAGSPSAGTDVPPNGGQTASPAGDGEDTPVPEPVEIVGIRFRGTGKVYYFSPNGITFKAGEYAIVETVRGMEFGDVTDGNRLVPASDIVQPLKPILRKADEKDLAHFRSNCKLEEDAKPVFAEKVQKNKLDMQLVDVEYTFDNSKLCFYFTADGRVDFRELVKDLAAVFHTRIELRQIGPRDEARLCGGIGICGRPVCCKEFLTDFTQVSIKMAKDQGLALASAKINGICGKLMCCVKYEQPVYEMESKRMPQPESEIDTPKGKAIVLESSFLSDKVKVKMVQDESVRTFTTAELNGEDKPARKERRLKTGVEGFALRDSFSADWPEPVADPEPSNEQKKPRNHSAKPDKQPKGGKNGGEDSLESGKGKPASQQPNRQNPHHGKNKRRFNRPGNVRSKDAGTKKDGGTPAGR